MIDEYSFIVGAFTPIIIYVFLKMLDDYGIF